MSAPPSVHSYVSINTAYWLSLKLLENFAKQADNRQAKTPLYNIVRSHFNLNDDFEILDIVLNKYGRKRDKVASIASLLNQAALENDQVALALYKDAAFEHLLTVKALIEKMDFDKDADILVSYSGGVFKAGTYILDPLNEMLINYDKRIKLIQPILSPVAGAALYALILNGNDQTGVVENLKGNN